MNYRFSTKFLPESIISAEEFVDLLKQNPKYRGGNIRLIACEAGYGDGIVPQCMANKLGVEVLAPTETVNVFPDGKMIIANNLEDVINGNKIGKWVRFKPKVK